MIQYKAGVNRYMLQPKIMEALPRIERIFNKHGYPLVITSTNDSMHKIGSLHYPGLAVDVRTRHLAKELAPFVADQIRDELKVLSEKFTVIYKPTHIHIHYDRRIQDDRKIEFDRRDRNKK